MGKSWKVALALGIGYFLGRTHKTRLALLLAAGAATGGFGGVAGRVLTSGGKRLAGAESVGKLSPEFGHVVDSLKGDLAEAGKAAAKAAISSKLDAVADSIHGRTEALRGQSVADEAAETDEAADTAAPDSSADDRRPRRRTEDGSPERGYRPEGDESSDRDRPRRPPRQRPSGDSPAARPRPPARDRPGDRQPASSRAGRPAPGHRGGGD